MKKVITRDNIIYLFLMLCNIGVVIYCASKNKVHYVRILGKEVFVGKTRDMLLGRNNINLIIILLFYIYMLVINCFFLKRKNTKRFMIVSFFVFFVIDLILFYIFTKKIY